MSRSKPLSKKEEIYLYGKVAEEFANSKDLIDAIIKSIDKISILSGISYDLEQKLINQISKYHVEWSDKFPEFPINNKYDKLAYDYNRRFFTSQGTKHNIPTIYLNKSKVAFSFGPMEPLGLERERLDFKILFNEIINNIDLTESAPLSLAVANYTECFGPKLDIKANKLYFLPNIVENFDRQILDYFENTSESFDIESIILDFIQMARFSIIEFILNCDFRNLIIKCKNCNKFNVLKVKRKTSFCSPQCRLKWNNQKRIESGQAKEYKRQKRQEGAKESYYG